MKKECFTLETVDAEKFRECTTCPIAEECTRTVYLRGARGAAQVGQALGLLAGLLLAVFAALRFPAAPQSSGWLLALSLAYIAAVMRVGKRYAARNAEEQDALARRAESK